MTDLRQENQILVATEAEDVKLFCKASGQDGIIHPQRRLVLQTKLWKGLEAPWHPFPHWFLTKQQEETPHNLLGH